MRRCRWCRVQYKDAGQRFELEYFKVFWAGAYAMLKILRRELAWSDIHVVGVQKFLQGSQPASTAGITTKSDRSRDENFLSRHS